MKALNEYFLMVVFTLLLSRVPVFANFMLELNREMWQWKVKKCVLAFVRKFRVVFSLFYFYFLKRGGGR